MKKIILCILTALFVIACKKEVVYNGPFFPDNNVVAHRGAWQQAGLPQNSIASLQRAIQIQCKGSEFDVWMTSDDSLVVTHDPLFFGKRVETNTYATLAKHTLSNGETLLTLRQYLLAGINQDQTKLFIEIKSENSTGVYLNKITDKVLALINELNAQSHMVYTSFYYYILQRIHNAEPDADVEFLGGSLSPNQIKSFGISGVDYEIDTFLTHMDWPGIARTDSLRLSAWTVDDAAQMDWLLDRKFDYITTDKPELLFSRILNKK